MAEFRKFKVDLDSNSLVTSKKTVGDPIGFDLSFARDQSELSGASSRRSNLANRQAALFSLAQSPFKNVAMMSFMMWMAGAQLHLFSIMTTASGVYQPISAILKSGEVFPPDPEKKLDTLTPRLIYCLVNGLGLAYACYRIYGMGLFPTHLTDWASTIPAPIVTEVAVSSLW